jgi:hypothetical protein
MKAKFFLTLVALTGLLFGNNSAFAATGSTTENQTNANTLSQTISNLIDLDRDAHSLVSLAIERALLAQKDPNSPEGTAASDSVKPIVNGRVAQPHPSESQPPVLINGTILNVEPPNRRRSEPRKPKINNGVVDDVKRQ